MAHTKEEALNFLSRSGKLAEPITQIASKQSEMYWLDQPFVTGTEQVSPSDLVGSIYEGLDASQIATAYGLLSEFLTTNRDVLVLLQKFNK